MGDSSLSRGSSPGPGPHRQNNFDTLLYAALVTQLWILLLGPVSPWLLVPATAAVTLPLAALSWRLIEAPALARKPRAESALARLPFRGRRSEAPSVGVSGAGSG